MTRTWLKISPYLLMMALPLTLCAKNPDEVGAALSQVQTQIKKLEKTVYHTHHKEKALIQELALVEKEIGDRAEKLRHLSEKKAVHEKSLSNLKNDEARIERQNLIHQEQLSRLVQATFMESGKEKVKLLLKQQDLARMSRLNQYYQYFYLARGEQIQQLQNELSKVQALKVQIENEQQNLLNLAVESASEQERLKVNKEKRQAVLAELAQKRSSAEGELVALQQQEQHLSQLFKTLQKKLEATPAYHEPTVEFAKMKHKLSLPIKGDVKLVELPHAKKTAKKSYIAADAGTEVHAVYGGKIVFAEWLRGVGLLLIIDHGNGYMSLYGNNQKLYKNLGDSVSEGEMIARVGQSGGHAEPGLYFEIRKDGEAIDPTSWFKQA